MDDAAPEATVQPTTLKKVGWEVSKDVEEGKLRIRMKNEQGKIIDKASIDINTPVDEIKQRLLARSYDVSNFNPRI